MKAASQLPFVLLILATLGFVAMPPRAPHGSEAPRGVDDSTAVAPSSGSPKRPEPPEREEVASALAAAAQLTEALLRVSLAEAPQGSQVTFDDLARSLDLRVVVAGVPDPCLGHMAFYFDQAVEALRRGAADLDYQQSEFLLPETSARWCGTKAEEGTPPSPEVAPFLLFQRSDSSPEFLLALLVRESPVLGPNMAELEVALQLADMAAQWAGEEPLQAHILGPFFSGSARTYGAKAQFAEGFQVQFVSGTASSAVLRDDLAGWSGNDIQVARTVLSDNELVRFLRGTLKEHARKIAYLTEFDTVFGSAAEKSMSEAPPTEKSDETAGLQVEYFRFPSAIAEIRAAHWQQKDKGDSGVVPGLRRTLEFRPEGAAHRADLPSPLDEVTKFQKELELGKLMTRICRQCFDALAISATDPLDVIFLAEESRKYCPGLRLITFGAEEIYLHPDVRQSLEGMLVVTTYPLLFSLEEWTSAADKSPFASHVAEGFYNAWLIASSTSTDDFPKLRGFPEFDYPAPACFLPGKPPSSVPSLKCLPAWLLAVRGGEYWPLSFAWTKTSLGLVELKDGHEVAGTMLKAKARPTGFAAAIGLLVLLTGILHLGGALWSTGCGWRMALPWANLFQPPDDVRRALWLQYTMANHVSFAALCLVLAPTALHAVHVAGEGERWGVRWLYFGLVGLGGALGLAAFGFALVRAFQLVRLQKASRYQATRSWIAIALCASFMALACGSACGQWGNESLSHQFALTRAFHPLGMSAWTPILLLAFGFAAWSLIGLMRVLALSRFTDHEPLCSPELPCLPHHASPQDDHVRSWGALPPAVSGLPAGSYAGGVWPYEAAVLGAIVPLFIHQVVQFQSSWDGQGRDFLLLLGLMSLSSLVVTTLVRFVALGIRLRSYLHWLAGQPMLEAFDRISVKMRSTFGVHFGIRVPDVSELEVSVSSATALAKLGAELAAWTSPAQKVDEEGQPSSPPKDEATEHAIMLAYAEVFLKNETGLRSASAEVRRAMHNLREQGNALELERGGHDAFFAASQTCHATLRALWDTRARYPSSQDFEAVVDTKDLLSGKGGAVLPTVSLYQAAVPPRVFVWMRLAEDFVAMRVATSVSHVILQLRLMLTFALTASFVTVLAVSSYPVEPTRLFRLSAWSLMLAVVVAAATMIVRLEQNEILSRLSGSRPGSVNLHFGLISQLVTYVLLPGLALVAYAFPELRDSLFASLPPALRLLP